MIHVKRILVLGLVLWCSGVSSALGQTEPKVWHYTPLTRVEAGKTRVIAFELSTPADSDLSFDAVLKPGGLVEVVRPPAVIEGERIGFVRVRGLAAGRATMLIGGVPIALEIVQPLVTQGPSPRIVGPATGAAVWGRVAVGVEMADVPGLESITLRVSAGLEIRGELSPGGIGPQRWAVFELNTDELPVGSVELVAEV
ncbi:MAG: hypothetical protein IID31_06980, partial [Planctomycetes bacterium]|nr:hypothetical protein [Planctomycetota bacterium]